MPNGEKVHSVSAMDFHFLLDSILIANELIGWAKDSACSAHARSMRDIHLLQLQPRTACVVLDEEKATSFRERKKRKAPRFRLTEIFMRMTFRC